MFVSLCFYRRCYVVLCIPRMLTTLVRIVAAEVTYPRSAQSLVHTRAPLLRSPAKIVFCFDWRFLKACFVFGGSQHMFSLCRQRLRLELGGFRERSMRLELGDFRVKLAKLLPVASATLLSVFPVFNRFRRKKFWALPALFYIVNWPHHSVR